MDHSLNYFQPHRSRRMGFTLVELLVVIGIIAVLISLLLPALNKARSQAMTVNCQSNLRQVYVATEMYANDYNGALVPNGGRFLYEDQGVPLDQYTFRSWDYYLTPYLGGHMMPHTPIAGFPDLVDMVDPASGVQVMACPAYLDPIQQVPYVGEGFCYGGWPRDNSYWQTTTGYVWRLKGGNFAWTGYPDYWPTQAERVILLIDSIRGQANIYSAPAPNLWEQSFVATADYAVLGIHCRHAKKANALFVDGHIESLTKKQIISFAGKGNTYTYAGTYAPSYPTDVFESQN
jgi:prepilin-type processing-associated H-X9-DG protein/prepilin-type N-terminal cleavage/methylation domain-containing protein